MELFAVICETCTARLKVRDTRAIGQILACPKCGGMVQITPPAGWSAPSGETLSAHADDSVASTGSTIQFRPAVKEKEALANAAAKRREAAAAAAAALPAVTPPAIDPTTTTSATTTPASVAPAATSSLSGSFSDLNLSSGAESASSSSSPAASTVETATEVSRSAFVRQAVAGVTSRASGVGRSMADNWIYWLCGPIAAVALVLVGWIVYQSTAPKPQIAAVDASAEKSAVREATPDPSAPSGEQAVDADPAPDQAAGNPADPAVAAPPKPVDDGPPDVDPPVAPNDPAPANETTENETNVVPGADRGLPVDAIPNTPNPVAPANDDAPAPDEAMPDEAAGPNHAAAAPNEANPGDAGTKVEKPVAADAPQGEGEPGAEDPDAAQPTISSPIDIDARLADPLEKVEFRRILLADFCDFISDFSTIPITLDIDGMATAGVGPDEALLGIKKTRTTVGDLLTSVLAEHGLVYEVQGQQLLITVPPASLIKVPYKVGELAGPEGAEGEKLAALVTRFICPSSWSTAGGKGQIEFSNGTLIVEQTPAVQRRVTTFLERLRVARGFAPKVAAPAGAPGPTTKYARAKERFQKPITGTYGIETPLAEVLEWLGRTTATTTPTRILIDGVSLTQVDRTARSPVKLVAEKQTLDEVLTMLLDPLDLTFRVVDDKTLQIYAKKPVAERYEFELHPIDQLLNHSNLEKILSVIREKVDPKSWVEAGGAGVIEYDPASKSLLVLQSPAAQIKLERMLDKSRAGAAARKAR